MSCCILAATLNALASVLHMRTIDILHLMQETAVESIDPFQVNVVLVAMMSMDCHVEMTVSLY